MNKTPVRQQVISRLTALNDQLCFFLLLEEELTRRLADFGPGVQSSYTSDVFAQSSYAPKLHVTLGKLPEFQANNRSFTFGAYFSTSYEVASDFFDLATQLLSRANGVSPSKPQNDGPEDAYIRTLAGASLPSPSLNLIRTLSYCRHRRNAFIHTGTTVRPAYAALVSTHGANLNQFWGTTCEPVDFTNGTAAPLQEHETITLIKLLRVSIEALDAHLASVLNKSSVLRMLAEAQFANRPTRVNNDVVKDRSKTLAAVLKSDYGAEAAEDEIETLVRQIGVR